MWNSLVYYNCKSLFIHFYYTYTYLCYRNLIFFPSVPWLVVNWCSIFIAEKNSEIFFSSTHKYFWILLLKTNFHVTGFCLPQLLIESTSTYWTQIMSKSIMASIENCYWLIPTGQKGKKKNSVLKNSALSIAFSDLDFVFVYKYIYVYLEWHFTKWIWSAYKLGNANSKIVLYSFSNNKKQHTSSSFGGTRCSF